MFAALRRSVTGAFLARLPAPTGMQIRQKNSAKNGNWWQPLMPALAPSIVSDTPGKGNRKKKMQQRRAQSVTNDARRIEGHRRAALFRQMKADQHLQRVRDVYDQYGNLLRSAVLSGRGAGSSGAGGDASSGDATPPPT